jgi:ABC-type transport system involved in multi-copper enzyme maturation permease subunit
MLATSERRNHYLAMTFLPIVERELRIAARLSSTYHNRTLAAGLVMLGAIVMLGFGALSRAGAATGSIAFHLLSFLALLFCGLEGVRKTADCLSEEKREGTLGLLFLTDLRGYDVVLGKFAANSLNSIYGLLAILPVLALPLTIGGVTPGEFWRMVLALANTLFFSLCAGMLVSARSRRENYAMGGTLLLVAAFMLLVIVPGLAPFSPAGVYTHAFATGYTQGARDFWEALISTQVLSWAMLAYTSAMLPRWWQEGDEARAAQPTLRVKIKAWLNHPRRKKKKRDLLATNPAQWLAIHDSERGLFLWGLTAVAGIACLACLFSDQQVVMPIFFVVAWLINLAFKITAASQACHCLAEARRNSALEMLLVTPLNVEKIIRGQLDALFIAFRYPAVTIIFIELFAVLLKVGRDAHNHGSLDGDSLGTIFLILYLALSFLDVVAVTWAGMWFGLSARNESRALTKTLLFVLVLPCAFLVLYPVGLLFFVAMPAFWISWCSSKLKAEFRTIAAQRYIPPSQSAGWSLAPTAPPVQQINAS